MKWKKDKDRNQREKIKDVMSDITKEKKDKYKVRCK